MRKIKSPKVRLAISLLKIFGIILLVTFIVWQTVAFDVNPLFAAFLILFAGGVIRLLYKLMRIVAVVAIFILIIYALSII